jgi:hypothetical protein
VTPQRALFLFGGTDRPVPLFNAVFAAKSSAEPGKGTFQRGCLGRVLV